VTIRRPSGDWHDWPAEHPPVPGRYIVWDGLWQRRVLWQPGYRYRGELCEWCSLCGYPPVPGVLSWRVDDKEWGKSK